MVFAFACEKPAPPPPTTLHISGIVTDKQTTTPLDSVKIYLEKHDLGDLPIIKGTFYSGKDGKFSLQFSPESGFNSYDLSFEKNGYCHSGCSTIDIDRSREYEVFNVSLVK